MEIERILPGNYHFKRYSLDYFLKKCHELGFKNIELWASGPHFHLEYFSRQDMIDLKNKLKYYDLGIKCLTPEQAVYPVSISHPDKKYREKSIDFFNRHIEAATFLDSPRVLVTTGIDYIDVDSRLTWEWCVEALQRISKKAENSGVLMVLEGFTKYSTQTLNGSKQILKMIEEVNSPALKVLLDTDVIATTGRETVAGFVGTLGSYINHVHFVDGNPGGHVIPGEGSLDMVNALEILENANYNGYYGLEFFDRNYYFKPEQALEKTLEWFEQQK
ncbi:protein FrlC [Natronobacillus azotifigens]|uniref:Sugar phosphate isomerase/epimerase n=1 Tax=Natronobacillus azotifigens TaxID=472978 RepID=A0A9J6RBG3_9BACI|nr:sugar phosphate isomerase/epimerase [Natronobacillus azotifigens]